MTSFARRTSKTRRPPAANRLTTRTATIGARSTTATRATAIALEGIDRHADPGRHTVQECRSLRSIDTDIDPTHSPLTCRGHSPTRSTRRVDRDPFEWSYVNTTVAAAGTYDFQGFGFQPWPIPRTRIWNWFPDRAGALKPTSSARTYPGWKSRRSTAARRPTVTTTSSTKSARRSPRSSTCWTGTSRGGPSPLSSSPAGWR